MKLNTARPNTDQEAAAARLALVAFLAAHRETHPERLLRWLEIEGAASALYRELRAEGVGA